MMNTYSNPVEVLEDEEVKGFFLGILDSGLTSEEKYEKFIQFFRKRNEIKSQILTHVDQLIPADEDELNQIISQVGQEYGLWQPDRILSETADSIRRAVQRLKFSQHKDGGWGIFPEVSEIWGTAYSLLCLTAVRSIKNLDSDVDIDWMIFRSVDWLEDHTDDWRVDNLGTQGEQSVYRVSIVARALHGAHKDYRNETKHVLDHAVKYLAESQNEDGGWDAQLWGSDSYQKRMWSEVGATGNAVTALASKYRPEFLPKIEKALEWLVQTQNEDGSWNNGSCRPELPSYELTGVPVINKTCDALKGFLVTLQISLPYEEYKPNIDKAVEWLRRQEKPIIDDEHRIRGWGWLKDQDGQQSREYSVFDFENTSMTLETLVNIPGAPLPLLIANAEWLIANQYRQDGEIEDGDWKMGHTARIALALIEYYKKIASSSLFTK